MCGIAGLIRVDGGPVDPAIVHTMCTLIEHRGPDEDGYYRDAFAALGMRRLSIIDVAGGQQPVRNEDGTVWAVFNGEIYNFRELRSKLEAAGHTFLSRSDTETIVHAYEVYGDDFPKHLDGMFSIALWDKRRRRLLLVRDRFGKKPLFYARLPSGLVFGSELKCLLVHPEFDRQIDRVAMDTYLAHGYVPAPRSIFVAAKKVPPAHLTIYEAGEARVQAYWSLHPRQPVSPLSPAARIDAAIRLESLLEAAVAKRLMSDVPLGAFLSGGLDSSVVVALMARLSTGPVKTFTIGFDDPRFNEAPASRRTAQALGTEHHELVVRPDLRSVLPTIVWGMDEPLADPSIVPTYYVSQMARKHVTVCLTGDGGDEVFAGYNRYQQALSELDYDRLPRVVRAFAWQMGAALPDGMRARRRLVRMASAWTTRYASLLTLFDAHGRYTLYHPNWRELPESGFPRHYEELLNMHAHADLVSALQWADIHSYMVDDVLVKVDRMSMVNSLETRAPLLDHHVVEFAFGLPSCAFFERGLGKLLFRDVARRLLPAEVLERRKSGFGIPHADWLRGPIMPFLTEILLADAAGRRGWFSRAEVARLIREHHSGRLNHGSRLWALLCLELWALKFLDAPPRDLVGRRPSAVASQVLA